MRGRIVALALGALGALGSTREAAANPLGTYGFGSRETALGGAVTADTSAASAVFYNPAGLALARKLELSVGYLRVDQRLQINGKDNAVDPVRGLNFGVVAPGTVAGVPFAFGLAVHLPDERISRVRTLRQDIPRWELYDNRAQILFIATTLAVRPAPWLAVGGGVAFLSSTRGDFGISGTASLKEPYDSQLRHQVDADLTTVRIPLLGVRFEPDERVSVGLSYRGESKLDLQLDADIDGQVDPGIGNLRVPVTYALSSKSFDAFHPRQVSLGSSVKLTPALRVNLDFVWTQWSAYQSATSRSTADLEVDLQGLPLAIPPDPKPTVVRDPGFHDRVAPRLGVEALVLRRASLEVPLRGGYVYERSPVPPQTGTTNFVDSDRHTIAAGVGLLLRPGLSFFQGEVAIDLHGALMLLPERLTTKKNPADFVGDFRQRGRQTNLGATLSLRL
jgi:long-chain fatty acid transport protein